MKKLKTKSREDQIHAADVIGDFARGKFDRAGAVVAWERTTQGKALVVFLPEAKVEQCECSATLLEQLKGLVAGLETEVAKADKTEGNESGSSKPTSRRTKR